MNKSIPLWLLSASLLALMPGHAAAQTTAKGRNIIIFVADGLRNGSVNAANAPTLLSIRNNGVYFANSHSLFPTFTTANGSAIATGHQLGDTGDFSNTIYSGYPVYNTGNFGNLVGTQTPFIENNQILGDLNDHYNGNYLNEESLMGLARKQGYNTASVGKVGPVAIQDVSQISPVAKTFPTPNTIFIDDATGSAAGIPLSSQLQTSLNAIGIGTVAPSRGANGQSGNNQTPGTNVANTVQQKYFADAMTKAILPTFVQSGKPFYALFWSRDPDGTQHNQGDSLKSLTPGINGSTSLAAVKNADNNLAQIVAFVQSNPQLANNTDIFITADHGFSTISKHDVDASGQNFVNDYASSQTYIDATGRQEVNTGFLPVGFLAIDIAHEFNLPLWDPDTVITTNGVRSYAPVNPAAGPTTATRLQHSATGDGLIGGTGAILQQTDAQIIVAANGGSDLIYVPNHDAQTVRRLVNFLSRQSYIGGLFVDDMFGSDIPGALPISSIGLVGSSQTPRPAIAVNFKTFSLDPNNPNQTGIEIADTGLQHGQGMHGSLSRADTFNNIAAIGPDFKSGYVDPLPMSNADIVPTIAKIIGIDLPFMGVLQGRILREALVGVPVGSSDLPLATQSKVYSGATNGNATVLLYQQIGEEKYYDRACLVDFTLASTAVNPCQ
jgi:hypothetical protein